VNYFDDELKFGPQEIVGDWDYGKVLDFHTTSSRMVGEDEFGNPQFETEYSAAGKLLHAFKYRDDPDAQRDLLKMVGDYFADNLNVPIDAVAPVPPSKSGRIVTAQIAEEIAKRIGAAFSANALIKKRPTEQMKTADSLRRRELLADAFAANPAILAGKACCWWTTFTKPAPRWRRPPPHCARKGEPRKCMFLRLPGRGSGEFRLWVMATFLFNHF